MIAVKVKITTINNISNEIARLKCSKECLLPVEMDGPSLNLLNAAIHINAANPIILLRRSMP